jgi:hypothetical protein
MPEADRVLVVCYPSNPTAYVADLDFYEELVAFAKKHEIFILSTSPMPKSISTTRPAALGAAGRARWTSRSSSPRCRRPIRWPAGAWASRSATSASSRRWRG